MVSNLMIAIRFTVPFTAAWKRVKRGMYGNTYNPSAKEEKVIAQYAFVARVNAGQEMFQGPVHFHLTCYGLRGDVDNALKLALDSCNKVLYEDDIQVVFATVRKIDSTTPRMEIEALSEAVYD